MRLSDYKNSIEKVIQEEGNLDCERLIITKNDFLMVVDGKVYNVIEEYWKINE